MTWLYSGTILLGSCLLFLVQPMCAKKLLPLLGGTPAAWNTCMVFFQAGLLCGYAYAHWLPRALGVSRHAILHVALLIAVYVTLPIQLPDTVPEGWHPVLWLLACLTMSAGLPFVLLAAGAPLLQRWFVSKHHLAPRDPYFLYAASNLGSFLALGLFPFVLEPYWTLYEQGEIWRFSFLALTALLAFCVPLGVRDTPAPDVKKSDPDVRPTEALSWRQRARWIVLALIPSSLLLSVTTHLTTDIAAIPLLWLIPMGLYLLTFTLVFASRPLVPHAIFLRWLPLVAIVLLIVMQSEATDSLVLGIYLVLGLHLVGFFWLAMVCHGELSRTRPSAQHLTDFYLCLALGGVLGGALNALIAPLIFPGLYEYPLMIVLACVFGLAGATHPKRDDWLWCLGIGAASAVLILTFPLNVVAIAISFVTCYVMHQRPARFALCLVAVLFASALNPGVHGVTAFRERSYFGIHRVTEKDGFRRLIHGNTVHGQQSLDPDKRHLPLTYYSHEGPIGDVFRVYKDDRRLHNVGVVGLGTGSLAAYANPGQDWTFFEIDPTVQRIAEDPKLFTYLSDAKGRVHIELGDARLQLQKSKHKFGLLVVDAFGSDAIPLHLLTREALEVYLARLEPHGLLAFHISNRYVDLEPVLANLAQDAQPPCSAYRYRHRPNAVETEQGIMASDWLVLARRPDDLAPLLQTGNWQPAAPRPDLKVWTDDFSNLFRVFRWQQRRIN